MNSAVRLCGSDSPVSEALSTCKTQICVRTAGNNSEDTADMLSCYFHVVNPGGVPGAREIPLRVNLNTFDKKQT